MPQTASGGPEFLAESPGRPESTADTDSTVDTRPHTKTKMQPPAPPALRHRRQPERSSRSGHHVGSHSSPYRRDTTNTPTVEVIPVSALKHVVFQFLIAVCLGLLIYFGWHVYPHLSFGAPGTQTSSSEESYASYFGFGGLLDPNTPPRRRDLVFALFAAVVISGVHVASKMMWRPFVRAFLVYTGSGKTTVYYREKTAAKGSAPATEPSDASTCSAGKASASVSSEKTTATASSGELRARERGTWSPQIWDVRVDRASSAAFKFCFYSCFYVLFWSGDWDVLGAATSSSGSGSGSSGTVGSGAETPDAWEEGRLTHLKWVPRMLGGPSDGDARLVWGDNFYQRPDKGSVELGTNTRQVPPLVKVCYLLMIAFFLSEGGLLLAFETQRPDFLEMALHHLLTIVLSACSFLCDYLRIGFLVLLAHGASDLVVYFSKIVVDIGVWNVRLGGRTISLGRVIIVCIFCSLVLSFAYFRLVVFPLVVLRSTWFDSWRHMARYPREHFGAGLDPASVSDAASTTATAGKDAFYPQRMTMWSFFNILLLAMYLLHCYWFCLILRSGIMFAKTGQARDMVANLSVLRLGSRGASKTGDRDKAGAGPGAGRAKKRA